MKKDFYELLGLKKGVSEQDIKRSYRKLAAKYHPDVSKEKNAEEKFKEISEAYEVLSDPKKRSQYDQFGHAASQGGFGGAGAGGGSPFGGGFQGGFSGGGFEDVYDNFFGGGRGRSSGPRPGRDVEVRVQISFAESVHGVKKTIKFTAFDSCDSCHGDGKEENSGYTNCSTCHGTGQVSQRMQTPFGIIQNQSVCPQCKGEGQIPEKPCSSCFGKGRVKAEKKVEVHIPAGVFDDALLRIAGKGEAGEKGAGFGDLLLHVSVSSSHQFQREGDDIHTKISVNVLQAILGTEAEIETIYDATKIKIPAGTHHGKTLRLRGKGMKKLGKEQNGDHIIHIELDIPTDLSDENRENLEKVAKNMNLEFSDKEGFFQKIFG